MGWWASGWTGVILAAVAASVAVGQTGPKTGPDVAAAMRKAESGDASGREELARLAASGRVDAEEGLGEVLMFGVGGSPDPRAACPHFERASAQYSTAMHNLALCAEQGQLTGAPDFGRAAALYERAAEMGEAKSSCALGNLLIAGRGVAKDAARGHALCLRAANAGVADAQADVGNQFLQGIGTAQSYSEARHWYKLAADQRQHQAARTLGQMYARGNGGPQSWAEAKRLWRIAAEEGDVYGASLLSTRLTAELLAANFRPGDPQRAADIEEAIKWSEVTIARDPDPKAVEAAKGGLGILQGLKEAEKTLPRG